MKRLSFEISKPIEATLPSRMDVALFAGFVSRRSESAVPSVIRDWLKTNGFSDSNDLLDVPVPVENWDIFDQLFAWDERVVETNEIDGAVKLDTYLGSAVHSFFQQGGKKCYVVRVGDNIEFGSERILRDDLIKQLVPGYTGSPSASADDRSSWYGIAYLYGLADVSILSVPDLSELVAADPDTLSTEIPEAEVPPEQFVECSAPQAMDVDDKSQYLIAPRCDDQGYDSWINIIHVIAEMLEDPKTGRATQLVASIPLPVKGSAADKNLIEYLSEKQCLSGNIRTSNKSISSAFVQLTYPWLKIAESKLPEDLNVPEGTVVGLLARNALLRGHFRSISYLPLVNIDDVFPQLNERQRQMQAKDSDFDLTDRVSIFSMTANGVRLISDVTTSASVDYRPSGVSRLVSMLVRESRRLGEAMVFESSGEVLWRKLTDRLNVFLMYLYRAGALNGASATEAFQVRCDRSIMTQNDIDNGRVIVQIIFSAAASIESIIVTLTMDNGGQYVDVVSQSTEAA